MGVFIFYIALLMAVCVAGCIITDIIIPLLEVVFEWLLSL